MRRVTILQLFLVALLGAALGLHALPCTTIVVVATAAMGVLLAALAVMHAEQRVRQAALLMAVGGFGVVAGVGHAWRYESVQQDLPTRDDVVVVQGHIIDEQPVAEGRRLLLELTDVEDVPATASRGFQLRPATGRLQVSVLAAVDVRVGDTIRARGRIHRPPPAFAPGTFAADLHARSRGIHGTLRVFDAGDVGVLAAGEAPMLVSLRARLRERLQAQVNPRFAGLLLALLIGDVSLFDDEQNAAYRHVGAGHLLAVSGLQVTLLAVLLQRAAVVVVMLLGGRRRRWQLVAAGVALLGVWAFVGLCGSPPSAVRAALMATAVVIARSSGRRVALVDAIAAAGLLTVLASPLAVDDAGFLLSYVAVLALVATSVDDDQTADPTSARDDNDDDDDPSTMGWLTTLHLVVWPKFRGPIIASLTAGLATAPLSAWLFGQFAPAGLVANVVLVPVASALQLPALLCGVVGAVFDLPWLTWVGGQAALVLESLVFGLAEVLPGVAAVTPPSAVVAVALVAAALIGGGLWMARRTGAAVVVALASLTVLWVTGRAPSGLRVTFLPVGQGDGAVVEFPSGEVMVVDAGGRVAMDATATRQERLEALTDPGRRVVVPFLQRRGFDHVDVMVASHPHPDHVGGLLGVAEAMPVGELWLAGDVTRPGALMAPLLRAVGEERARSTPALLGMHRFGEATVEVLGPAPVEGTPTYSELHANDNSLVLRVCFQGSCVLLPGDVESFGEDALVETVPDKLQAAVVKAGHHGSRTSSTPAFVAATGAAHVVLCTGLHNTFHFPSAEVVERWRAAGAKVWDTAVHGEVRFVLNADGVSVQAYRTGR